MSLEIDEDVFENLLALEKNTDKNEIQAPPPSAQNKHGITATFKSKEKFTLIINRKGHIRTDEFTLLMKSNSNGIMMRYDICGADHNGIPAPHLHIFDNNHNNGTKVIYGNDLVSMHLLPSIKDNYDINFILNVCLPEFLKYNNVSLKHVEIKENMV